MGFTEGKPKILCFISMCPIRFFYWYNSPFFRHTHIILYYIILYYIILYYIIYIYSISCCKNSHDVPICDLTIRFLFGGFLQQPQFIQHPAGVRSLQRIVQDLHLDHLPAEGSEGELVFFGCLGCFKHECYFFSIIYGIMMVNDG